MAADVVEVAAAETGRTAEAEVGVGEIFQQRTPPTNTDRKIGGGGQNGQEGGRSV